MKNFKEFIVIGLFCVAALIYWGNEWSVTKKQADAKEYFEKRCAEDAGEFIYRTVENVEGLFQMRPRDPRDYFDRLAVGDIPEDPYGHTNAEAQIPAALFLSFPLSGIPKFSPYQYFETVKPPNQGRYLPSLKYVSAPIFTEDKYWNYKLVSKATNGRYIYEAKQISELKSQYGYTWREVKTEKDEIYGVKTGELIVKEIKTDEILGIKRGFFYQDTQTDEMEICPKDKSDRMVLNFVRKVLLPKGSYHGGNDHAD